MNVTITAWTDSTLCTWCDRTKSCVTVTFDDGFLEDAPLCWQCLQKSVRVRGRKDAAKVSSKEKTG